MQKGGVMKKEYLIGVLMVLVLLALFMYQTFTDQGIEIEEIKEEVFIKVYISGEIKNPGVYSLKEDERLDSLIKKAGGFTKDAIKDKINLAKKLKDGEMVVIHSIKDKKEGKEYSGLDIFNYGSLDDIKSINGIGEVLAKNILNYRNTNGFFSSYDDLIHVNGIGEGKLSTIKKSLEVD